MSRSRRIEPAAIHITQLQSISRAEAEQIISSYIDSTESSSLLDAAAEAAIAAENTGNSDNVVDSIASAIARNENIIGQLKRVQRDLRGLPPVLRNERSAEQTSDVSQKFQNVSEDVEMLNADIEENAASSGKKRKQVTSEERKRLKKERRKAEKRSKSMAAASKADEDEEEEEEEEDSE